MPLSMNGRFRFHCCSIVIHRFICYMAFIFSPGSYPQARAQV